ncbi:asparagine synthase [Streptomyces minutiscleroticus]|uniref:asparagine synthase (glutamine-hydrolyzing) n=1 Tax=Streptomyces minutiscleroticus TaxID=68238 RepID=A0A918KCN5_9ACTN|nr:asparagine synthase [Streptomyces minutiscleroticus]
MVLPDSPAGTAVGGRLAGGAVLAYASGRPCLVTAAPRTVVRAEAGGARLAVIGDCPVTAGALRTMAARLSCPEDADAVAARLPGCFHLVAVVGDRVRVQGTASGLRRVFFTRLTGDGAGTVVAGDRAGVLAALAGADLDAEALAVRLLDQPPPVLTSPLWRGVRPVPPGDAAHLDPRGVRTRTWWTPPEPHLPLSRGAPAFADALREAVRVRVGEEEVVACDLSGGLDSTPVAFLADAAVRERHGRLVTFAHEVADPAHDDAHWTARALRHLSGEHVTALPEELPGWFAGVAQPVDGLDEPLPWLRALARVTATAGRLAGHGARVHLTGHGGDELTLLSSSYLHDLARTRPSALWPRLRNLRARTRWPHTACVRALADRRPYGTWLADQARLLTTPPSPLNVPDFGWELPWRLPAWTTPAAADTVSRRVLRAAPAARPCATARSQHQALSAVRATAPLMASLRELTARAGAAVHAPYLDDRVVAAALAVRLDHRAVPGRYKPLTVAAMRPHVPAACLARATKAEFSALLYEGLRAHRDQLHALADDALLVRLGLADPAALRELCVHTPVDAGAGRLALDVFVGVENWLRARSRAPHALVRPSTPAGVRDHAPS